MKKLNIKVQFQGGLGFARFTFHHNGHITNTVVMNGDDTTDNRDVILEDGLYLIGADGVSPKDGTLIKFSKTVSPTPALISEGPIDESYVLIS